MNITVNDIRMMFFDSEAFVFLPESVRRRKIFVKKSDLFVVAYYYTGLPTQAPNNYSKRSNKLRQCIRVVLE